MKCRKCGSDAAVKNGFMAGAQRYKCKNCSFQFTKEAPHGRPMRDKILSLILYLSGISMNMTAKIIGVSTQTIMRWIRLFYHKFANEVQQVSSVEEIEVDEMYSYLGKKKNLFGSGKLLIITLESSSGGNAVIVVPKL
jgi:transposase-like protein